MSEQEETLEGPTATPAPSGQPAEGTVTPTPEENVSGIADGDDIPDSEEEITQDDEPIDLAEAEEDQDSEDDA